MKKGNGILWLLAALFGIFMSVPFLIPHCGFFALFGIVPLLCLDRIASGRGLKKVWRWHYSAFVLWNALTTFWVCNATVAGGIFAILANALQMSLIFGIFRFSKKYLYGVLPYILLAAMWIAWEKAYFSAEISWPWLTLGNSFARSTGDIQWYEYTGALGGSLWIWVCNLGIFGMMVVLSDGRWAYRFNAKAKIACITGLVASLTVPFVISAVILRNYKETDKPLDVLITQPNIDPYQKFQAMSREQQDAIMRKMLSRALSERDSLSADPLLILTPETFTRYIDTDNVQGNKSWRTFTNLLKPYPGVNMILGAATMNYINSADMPSYTARKVGDGKWIETHNSSLMIDGTGRTEIYHKSKLVVGTELMPYPAVTGKIDKMLGGVMGHDIGQDEISLLNCVSSKGDTIPVGNIICYESIYGEYCTDYINKGAEVLAIITNDAWWGDTPGYVQHLSYASLRAIETRRDIARCANTGISAIIDQTGKITERTSWWSQDIISGKVMLNDKVTFFVQYGDITGRLCTFLFILISATLCVNVLLKRKYPANA